jgi:hypothetical protein
MRHLKFAAAVALALISMENAVKAQSWGAPSPDFARYGIRTMVCDERTHAAPCLGLACVDGALALVSAAGSGGPMDGPTRVSNGRSTFTLRFEFDPRAIDRLGVAAARTDLTAAQFEALLAAQAITLTAQSDTSIRHRFSTRGLAREWRRVAAACR